MVRESSKKLILISIAAFVVLVLAELAGTALVRAIPSGRSGLHAVFLTNGQVYFGTIERDSDTAIVIRDVYYLKLPKAVVSQEDLEAQADVSLVKLGNELQAPEDRMEISRSQVLFIEKLRSEGKVAKAIESFHGSNAR